MCLVISLQCKVIKTFVFFNYKCSMSEILKQTYICEYAPSAYGLYMCIYIVSALFRTLVVNIRAKAHFIN